MEDGYRRLCGNAFDSAVHEAIEHDIADADDPGGMKAVEKALEMMAGDHGSSLIHLELSCCFRAPHSM